jgi:hypothetical protein
MAVHITGSQEPSRRFPRFSGPWTRPHEPGSNGAEPTVTLFGGAGVGPGAMTRALLRSFSIVPLWPGLRQARPLLPWLAALSGAAVSACADPVPAMPPQPASAPVVAQASAPAGAPLGGMQSPAAGDERFAGRVQEVLSAGGYTYLRVRSGDADRWVVTMGTGAETGQDIEVEHFGTRHDFVSRRLDRTFDVLAFGRVRVVEGKQERT